MPTQAHAEATRAAAGLRSNLAIWIVLIAITGFQVFLASLRLPPVLLLTILAGLAVVQAAISMSYFMHLKYEKVSLTLWVIPAIVIFTFTMAILFLPDAFRLLHMRSH